MNSSDFDFDLFFSSHCEFCATRFHFATAGDGDIPRAMFENYHHDLTRRFLKNIPSDLLFEYKLSPGIGEIFEKKRAQWREQSNRNYEFDEEAYLQDFVDYAKRGCFSFDRTNLGASNDNAYHLVAYPDLGWNPEICHPDRNHHGQMVEVDKLVNEQLRHPLTIEFDAGIARITLIDGRAFGLAYTHSPLRIA